MGIWNLRRTIDVTKDLLEEPINRCAPPFAVRLGQGGHCARQPEKRSGKWKGAPVRGRPSGTGDGFGPGTGEHANGDRGNAGVWHCNLFGVGR
jgi:hypothetical protein